MSDVSEYFGCPIKEESEESSVDRERAVVRCDSSDRCEVSVCCYVVVFDADG